MRDVTTGAVCVTPVRTTEKRRTSAKLLNSTNQSLEVARTVRQIAESSCHGARVSRGLIISL